MGGSNKRFRGRRVAAVLGAITLGLVGAVGAAAPATADSGNIDFTERGSIIIHKHAHQSGQTGSPAGGNLTSPGVENVGFTAYPITSLPLNDADSWITLRTFTSTGTGVPVDACTGPTLGGESFGAPVVSGLTDSNGRVDMTNLPVAAYLLCETTTPSSVVDKAQPFVVTIPYSYNESWLYNVNVYPKNGVATVSKSLDPQTELGLGATASFPVTTDIPAIAGNANFTHYWVQDPMDSRLTNATVTSVTVDGVAVDTSYYLTPTTNSSNLVTLEFTPAGLAWLKGQGGKKLVTTFTGTVSSVGSGAISNSAFFSADTAVGAVPSDPIDPIDPSNPAYPGVESADVTQNWGDLAVQKVDAGATGTGVEGAVFEVYAAADPYAATCNSTATTGNAISVNTLSVFPSGTNGLVHIPGLFVSDDVNDPGNGATQRCYVLKEIVAPAGFILPADPFRAVTVKTGVTDTAVAYDATILNTREVGVVLPMTGSNGIVALSVAGTVLIATGLTLAFLARRRRQTA